MDYQAVLEAGEAKQSCAAGWDTPLNPCATPEGYTRLHYCINGPEHIGRHKCDCGRGRGNIPGDKEIVTNFA